MPKRFDICVLGLGATGYATAAFCAHRKMRVNNPHSDRDEGESQQAPHAVERVGEQFAPARVNVEERLWRPTGAL